MIKLSQITPETTYAEIQQQVEANLKEGLGIPYECLILMARTLEKQANTLVKTIERLNDAKARLPLEDVASERQRLARQKAAEAALRICNYLVPAKPHFVNTLVDEEKIDMDDFLLILQYNGISTERYEG